jgi:hypothetical protein
MLITTCLNLPSQVTDSNIIFSFSTTHPICISLYVIIDMVSKIFRCI